MRSHGSSRTPPPSCAHPRGCITSTVWTTARSRASSVSRGGPWSTASPSSPTVPASSSPGANMTTPHISQLMLDALPLRALDRDGQARVDAPLAGCTRCREELERAAELRRHFTAHVQPAGLPARPRRWWWLMAPAVASVLLIVAIGPWQQPATSAPTARVDEAGLGELGIKGDASWLVFANRAGRVLPVHDGTELEAGDRIRFMVIPGGARYLMVASIAGRGAATIR